jgi:hypothetical protein
MKEKEKKRQYYCSRPGSVIPSKATKRNAHIAIWQLKARQSGNDRAIPAISKKKKANKNRLPRTLFRTMSEVLKA